MPVLTNTRPKINTDRVRTEVMKWDYGFWFSDDIGKWIGKGAERRRDYQERYRKMRR